MFIKRKISERIKTRGCVDNRKQRNYIQKENASFPTVSKEGLMVLCVLNAKENYHVATFNIDSIFLRMATNKRTHIILNGKIINLMTTANPSRYKEYATYTKNGDKTLWLEVKKALYGYIESTKLL